jgi:hypothetical protein
MSPQAFWPQGLEHRVQFSRVKDRGRKGERFMKAVIRSTREEKEKKESRRDRVVIFYES